MRAYANLLTFSAWVLLACGRGGTEPNGDSLELTAPQTALVPGESMSLSAVVKMSDGSTRPGAPISFTISPPSVATVTAGGVVTALAAGTATISARSGTASAELALRVDQGGFVTSQGGTVRAYSAAIELIVPAGALSSPTAIRFVQTSNPLLDPTAVVGSIFAISPASLGFQTPATLRIRFGSVAPFGIPPEELRVREFVSGAWSALPQGSSDGPSRVASASLAGAGLVSVGWVPPAAPCTSPESRQFDFWLGRFNATLAGAASGTSEITLGPGGCAIFELFVAGGVGRSISVYVPGARRWYQTYIDDAGNRVELEGEFVNGAMDLRTPSWASRTHGLTRWSPEGVNVRQRVSMLSTDGGSTYGPPQYDFLYVPR